MGWGPSAQERSFDHQILVVACMTKEISGADEQASNLSISPFLSQDITPLLDR